jgi:hypothetical protein
MHFLVLFDVVNRPSPGHRTLTIPFAFPQFCQTVNSVGQKKPKKSLFAQKMLAKIAANSINSATKARERLAYFLV